MDFELVASIVAMFIALCALGVSIWQGMETRKNYRLSVTPSLRMDDNFTAETEIVGICVSNKGIGPAILEKITITFLGKEYDYISDITEFFKDFNTALKTTKLVFNLNIFSEGIFIAPGEDFPIIFLKNPSEEEVSIFLEALFMFSISIHYKSIYGKPFVLNYQVGGFVV